MSSNKKKKYKFQTDERLKKFSFAEQLKDLEMKSILPLYDSLGFVSKALKRVTSILQYKKWQIK